MPSIRLTPAQRRLLKRAARILSLQQRRTFTAGEAVAELARSVVWMEPLYRKDKKRRRTLGDLDPLFDPRVGGEGMSRTASRDVDKILYGGKRQQAPNCGKRSRPARSRARSK